ncbi:MAG: nucleotidyltransferase family protein [Lachnospiraceae bacterium]|nr:nucleotidyltransferase family protein [Lachnospiraceae bacterium]
MENKDIVLFEELCDALSQALYGIKDNKKSYSQECFKLANEQGVLTLLQPVKDCFEENIATAIEKRAQACANSNIRLSYLARYILHAMNENEIPACLLKGASIAADYPIPELRHFSDVDVYLLDISDLDATKELLESLDFKICERQDSRHHIEYVHSTGLKLELHTKPTRAFEVRFANDYINKVFATAKENIETISVYGMEFKILPKGINALYILLHILQHYLNAGFGLNLICDYSMYWNSNSSEELKKEYKEHIKNLGLSDFSDMLSKLSYAYLGGEVNCYPWINIEANAVSIDKLKKDDLVLSFVKEILASGSYGRNDTSRIVNLKDNSIIGLVSQFHHQMKENFPKGSKVFIIWPGLWIATLIIFIRNNSRVRKTSTMKVLKTAFKRGDVTRQLHLWKR